MAMYCYVWCVCMFMATYGYLFVGMAMYGYVWLCRAMYGYAGLCMAVSLRMAM